MIHLEFSKGAHLNTYRILVADDDPTIREVLTETLGREFTVMTAENGEEAVQIAKAERPDLVILDVNMPVRDGIWACRELRSIEETRHIPILILSSRTALNEKLEAYDVGADDYLEKPFTAAELRAKVAAKRRRLAEKRPQNIEKGNLKLAMDRMEVTIAGQKQSLSVLETKLLAHFLQFPDKVHPRRQILLDVWKDVNVSDRTVDAHIVSLRRKIADFDFEIVTVYGAGYSLRPKAQSH